MSITRTGEGGPDSTVPFGGSDMLLTGDFHQFPPVGQYKKALYISHPFNHRCEIGRNLFLQFQTVVLLTKQMRIVDYSWTNILRRARSGDCSAEDISAVQHLVLTDPTCSIPDFASTPWDDTILITPRNSVRTYWNEAASAKHSRSSGNVEYSFAAEDSVHHRRLTTAERFAVASLSFDDSDRLPAQLTVFIQMKVMVTKNICTHAGIANGSRGTIAKIVLDEREPWSDKHEHQGRISLMFPPAMLLFKPAMSMIPEVGGLSGGLIPIFPEQGSFNINTTSRAKVQRRQFAITPAYAFTDFKSQGQTIEQVIVDLGKTSSFALDPFHAYVALSRSRGRETIRLLRDFDDKLLTHHPSEDLRQEDERLSRLAKATQDCIQDRP